MYCHGTRVVVACAWLDACGSVSGVCRGCKAVATSHHMLLDATGHGHWCLSRHCWLTPLAYEPGMSSSHTSSCCKPVKMPPSWCHWPCHDMMMKQATAQWHWHTWARTHARMAVGQACDPLMCSGAKEAQEPQHGNCKSKTGQRLAVPPPPPPMGPEGPATATTTTTLPAAPLGAAAPRARWGPGRRARTPAGSPPCACRPRRRPRRPAPAPAGPWRPSA